MLEANLYNNSGSAEAAFLFIVFIVCKHILMFILIFVLLFTCFIFLDYLYFYIYIHIFTSILWLNDKYCICILTFCITFIVIFRISHFVGSGCMSAFWDNACCNVSDNIHLYMCCCTGRRTPLVAWHVKQWMRLQNTKGKSGGLQM